MTEHRTVAQPERVLAAHNRVLEHLATGARLDDVLQLLVSSIERLLPDVACTVFLLDADERTLRMVAAPSLPDFYLDATKSVPVGPTVGSCGAAAYLGRRVVVEDVLTHPNWAGFHDVVQRAGVRACWSEPILSRYGGVLGTFAMYYRDVRAPSAAELDFIEVNAHVAGLAIECKRGQDDLRVAHAELEERVLERTARLRETNRQLKAEVAARRETERELRESEGRFRELAENISEVFWLTNADLHEVLYVSPAYERIWQRPARELYENPLAWIEAIHPEDREGVRAVYRRDVPLGKFDVEYRILRPDGTIRWIHDRGFSVRDESGQAVRTAGIAQDVTSRKLHEVEAEAQREQLRRLAEELVLAEERERRRLAVDLHDGLNQLISLSRLKLAALRKRVEGELSEGLREVQELVAQADTAARTLTFQLSLPVLHDLGLAAAVRWLAADIGKSYGLAVSVRELGTPHAVDERLRMLLYRTVRELLINVAKHAAASSTQVTLAWLDEGGLRIEVADDGKGFDPAAVTGEKLGLFGVRERLLQLGGRLEIESASGRGTRVRIFAPGGAA